MDFLESSNEYAALVASAADMCVKPWKHSVIIPDLSIEENRQSKAPLELTLRIECRNFEGQRHPENDLDLEIYRSGRDINLMLCWCNQLDRPILWQGQHPVWMDGNNGQRCQRPPKGDELESFARRLRALFEI